jgi:dUTP pyrophosphatase
MIERPYIVVKLDNDQCMPKRAHATDAGADLVSQNSVAIYPGEKHLIDTGVAIKIPEGYVGLVYNRSSQGKIGIAIPHSVGVIDSDYRGNIKVLLVNNGQDPYHIEEYKTKIAQLVITPIELVEFKPWDPVEESWEDTQRGTGGFGSTDKGNT